MSPQQRVMFFRRAVPYMAPTFALCCREAREWLSQPLSERPEPLSVPPSGIPPELAVWAPPRPSVAAPSSPPAWFVSAVPTPPPSPSSAKRSMSPPPGSPPPEEDEGTPAVPPSLRVAAPVAPVATSTAALAPSLADQVTPPSTWHYTLVHTRAKLLAFRESFAPVPYESFSEFSLRLQAAFLVKYGITSLYGTDLIDDPDIGPPMRAHMA